MEAIITVKQLRSAIRRAKGVYVIPLWIRTDLMFASPRSRRGFG